MSCLANPWSPIRGLFQALAVVVKQSSDSCKKNYIGFVCMDRSNDLLNEMIDIRLTECGIVYI